MRFNMQNAKATLAATARSIAITLAGAFTIAGVAYLAVWLDTSYGKGIAVAIVFGILIMLALIAAFLIGGFAKK